MTQFIDADAYVVINDGLYQYPVRISDLHEGDTEESLRAMTGEEYSVWCQKVPGDFAAAGGNVGSEACIDFCERLKEADCTVWHIWR